MLVAKAPLEVLSLAWPDELSGLLLVRARIVVVGLNRRHSAARRHFSFWHEVGHYLMHHRTRANPPLPCRASPSKPLPAYEREANAFAACVTMPREWVERLFGTEPGLDALARRFHVSPQAMARRLRELGYD